MNKDGHHYKNKPARNDKFLFFTPANSMDKTIKYSYDPQQLEQITLRELENKKKQLEHVDNDRVFFSCLEYELEIDFMIMMLFKLLREKMRLKNLKAEEKEQRLKKQKQLAACYLELQKNYLLLCQLNGFRFRPLPCK